MLQTERVPCQVSNFNDTAQLIHNRIIPHFDYAQRNQYVGKIKKARNYNDDTESTKLSNGKKRAKPHRAIERMKCMRNWGQKRVVCCGWANWWVRIPWCRWYLANCVSISVIDPNRIDCNTNKRCFRFNWSRKMDFPHPDLFSFESFEMFDTIL